MLKYTDSFLCPLNKIRLDAQIDIPHITATWRAGDAAIVLDRAYNLLAGYGRYHAARNAGKDSILSVFAFDSNIGE